MLGGAGGVDSKIDMSLDALYPERPLADEDASKDWHFIIGFTIELLPPTKVRQDANLTTLPPSPPQPETTPDEADREAHTPHQEVQS